MIEKEVSDEMKPLKVRVEGMIKQYEQSLNYVKEQNNQAVQDFLARRLYDMTAEIMMSLLIIDDASRAPELFAKSANIYVRMAEENVMGKYIYIHHFTADDLENFKANAIEEKAV